MLLLLILLAFVLIPVAELYVFVEVAHRIGFLPTIFWIVAVSAAGAWLVKRQGLGILRRANARARRGEIPGTEMINGVMVLLAGALMLAPGFVTDALGLLLLLPPTRAVVRRVLRSRFRLGPIVIGTITDRVGRRTSTWDAVAWEDVRPPDRRELR